MGEFTHTALQQSSMTGDLMKVVQSISCHPINCIAICPPQPPAHCSSRSAPRASGPYLPVPFYTKLVYLPLLDTWTRVDNMISNFKVLKNGKNNSLLQLRRENYNGLCTIYSTSQYIETLVWFESDSLVQIAGQVYHAPTGQTKLGGAEKQMQAKLNLLQGQ